MGRRPSIGMARRDVFGIPKPPWLLRGPNHRIGANTRDAELVNSLCLAKENKSLLLRCPDKEAHRVDLTAPPGPNSGRC